jgi:hypothetical protein
VRSVGMAFPGVGRIPREAFHGRRIFSNHGEVAPAEAFTFLSAAPEYGPRRPKCKLPVPLVQNSHTCP